MENDNSKENGIGGVAPETAPGADLAGGEGAEAAAAAAADDAAAEEECIASAAAEAAGAECGAAPDAAALEAALAAEKDRNVRLYADFENFRRRMERERLETWGRAEHDILADLLPVVDNFDRAIGQAGDDPFSAGVKMVHSALLDFLKKRGVEAIDSLGKPFDPALHEAVAYQPSPDAAEGTVIYETRKGYRVGDSVLRPASVIVSSGAPAAGKQE